VLWVINLVRLARWPQAVFADLTDHRRGPGFFTWVAGSAVFGNQVLLFADQVVVAVALAAVALGLWLVVTYAFSWPRWSAPPNRMWRKR
jgi:hypothetical protein